MVVSHKLHDPAALPPGNEPPESECWKAEWIPVDFPEFNKTIQILQLV
jgi:hypothetical protein